MTDFGCRDCAFTGWVPAAPLTITADDGSSYTYDSLVRGCPRCRPGWTHPDDTPPQQEAPQPDRWYDR